MINISKSSELKGHTNYIHSLALSSDDKLLVSGSHDKTIKIWDASNGKELQTLHGHTGAVNCVAISPDKKYIASGSYDKTVKIWNAQSGTLIKTLGGHDGIVWSLDFDSTGKMLASAGNDFLIKLWDIEHFIEVDVLDEHRENILTVAFNPANPKMLLSGSYDDSIIVWDLELLKNKIAHQQFTIREIRFTKDGRYFAFCGDANLISIFETHRLSVVQNFSSGQGRVWSLDFTHDNKYIATAGANDFTIKVWDVVTGELSHTLNEHKSWISAVRFNNAGNKLYSGSGDNTIIIWDVGPPVQRSV